MTAATAADRSAQPGTQRAGSTTRRALQRYLAALLVMTAAVFATTLMTFVRVQRTAETVHTRTAPAIVELAAARLALLEADAALVRSVKGSGVRLTGPGEEFQNQMAIASQRLTQVAEDNVAGEPGTRRLQLVEGLLVTYQGLIEQADAHLRQASGNALGLTDLLGASRLLHGTVAEGQNGTLPPTGGILSELDQLADDQQQALNDQIEASSMTWEAILAVLVPLLCLLALLLAAQVTLRRRFRRRINRWLLLATVLLLAMAATSVHSATSQHRLQDSRGTLLQLVNDRQRQGSTSDLEAQLVLRDLVRIECVPDLGCGYTVETLDLYLSRAAAHRPADDVDDRRLTEETAHVTAQTTEAAAGAGLEPGIYIMAILAAAAVFLGFRPRLSEYRYRPR